MPILGFLVNPASRLIYDPMWSIYRVQELFEMPLSLFWSPLDYFFMLQSRKYVIKGKWGSSLSIIYFRRGGSLSLFDSEAFSAFPSLLSLISRDFWNHFQATQFNTDIRLMTGFYNRYDLIDFSWGLSGNAIWPLKYRRDYCETFFFNKLTMSMEIIRSKPGEYVYPTFRSVWGWTNETQRGLFSSFYYNVIRSMELYSLTQERRKKRFLRWLFIYDLRFVRLVLREWSNFSTLVPEGARILFIVLRWLNQIFSVPRRLPKHSFHMVSPSPWPLYTSLAALVVVVGLVQYMHSFSFGLRNLFFGLFFLVFIMGLWWRDVIREGVFEGVHTKVVQKGLKMGMVLFIVSEVLFFFAFFWAFFHSSLAPAIQIGSVWPPVGISVFDPWGIPLLNTLILLLSGLTITYTHHGLLLGYKDVVKDGFLVTLLLAFLFTFFQGYEYLNAAFSISDGIYGSTFFMATGFHGFHVLIGTLFILVCFLRRAQFTVDHHVGFEAAAWYWHFVDVVWLFLFVTIYWWGSL